MASPAGNAGIGAGRSPPAAAGDDGWDNSRSAAGGRNPWLIVAIISLPTFMEVLDTSIANVSLDHIAGGLSVTVDQATWVLTSYLVANAIVIPISGWLSDAIGRKRYFLISIALFTISSLVCGIAPNLTTLIIARIFQGIGGGGLAPVEQSMLIDTFPPKQRGMAIAAFAIVVVVGPVLGPTLGGLITETASWHWVFLINVPIGIAAWFLADIFVDEPKQVKDDRAKRIRGGLKIDYIGVLLVAVGLGLFELTLDRGEREDWFASGLIVTTATLSAVSIIALIFWELNHKDPVVDLKLFKNRSFAVTTAIMGITGLILYGTTQLIPQMLQSVMGYSSYDAGLALTLGGIGTLVAVPFAGRMVGKVDARLLLGGALLVQAAALWNMSYFSPDISFADAAFGRLWQAIALPFLFVPINAVAYQGLARESTAQASSIINVARNLGGSIGISLSQSMLAGSVQRHQGELVEKLNPLDPNYNAWIDQAKGALAGVGDPNVLPNAVLYQQMSRQAVMMGFIDVFQNLMVLILVLAPVVIFMRSGKGGDKPPGGGMGH